MKTLRFTLVACIVLGISAAFVDSANAGFSFKQGVNDGSVVDRHCLWHTKADGCIHLTTEAQWDAAKAFVDGGGVVELAQYFIVDSLRSGGLEYYSLGDDGELTGVIYGMEVVSISTFSGVGSSKFFTIELAAVATKSQFRMHFEDGVDPVATPFNGFLDPVLNRDAGVGSGQPFDASGAVETGTALLDGEIIADNLADGKFIVITVQVLDSAGGLIDGISGAVRVFADVTSDAGGLDGTMDFLVAPDSRGAPGSDRDLEINARFFFNGTSPTLVAGFGSPQNVTGVSTDPFIFTVIPEPSSFALFGIGAPFLIGMALRRRKKNKATA